MAKRKLNFWKALLDRIRKIWKRDATPKNLCILAGVIFLLTGMIAILMIIQRVWNMEGRNQNASVQEVVAESASIVSRHPLTGQVLSESLKASPHVFGIMVENSADAWPLSGIDDAFLVIEAPVEGNIPRFIAFFSEDQDVKKIGPVRSARLYYLDWNSEFQGIFGHVGGSPDALEVIKKNGTFDLNQFFQSEYYYRDERTRYAPHNVYTTTDDLRKSIMEIDKRYSAAAPSYGSWKFTDGVSVSSMAEETFIYWGNGYDIRWNYDPETNMYSRSQGENTYTTNNVVIIATDIGTIVGDDKGRRTVQTVGEGLVTILKNGTRNALPWTWKKTSASDRMRFYDEQGNEVIMNAGKTWIEVVDDLGRVGPPFEGGVGGD